MKHHLAALTLAGLLLAQMSSYNGGIPMTPGTNVPENNPATAIAPPPSNAPSSSRAPGPPTGSDSAAGTAPSGPAYSFGAAPAPTLSTGH